MLWLLILTSFISKTSSECICTRYKSDTLNLTCLNINSNNIHQKISTIAKPAPLNNLKFENSSIIILTNQIFSSFKQQILVMNLSKCAIETIQNGAFENLNIQELYLQSNNLTKISKNIFANLTKLKILDLSYNKINSIESGSFLKLDDLRQIFLNSNYLTQLPRYLFHYLKQVRVINLEKNYLKVLDLSFSNFAVFKIIFLEENQIELLECETLRNSFLDVIDLNRNKLTKIEGLCLPTITEEINLRKNFIQQISNFKVLKILKFLDLSLNNLSDISGFLNNLENLQYLKLQENNLIVLPPGIFKDLKSLRSLNLSKNSLELLEFGIFSGLQNVEILDLSYNKLSILEEDVFQNFNNLKFLNVSFNQLQYINLVKLKTYSVSLKFLDLIGNNISCQKLSAMFSYKLNLNISKNIFLNVSNVNGVPCVNFNSLLQNNKIQSNILRDIQLFLETDFKNSSFYNFFHSNFSVGNNYQKTDLVIAQINKNNGLFIVFAILCCVLCVLLVGVLIFTRKLFKQMLYTIREPEMQLL